MWNISTYLPYVVIVLYSCFIAWSTAAAAKLLQSCPTLSDPMDCSPPGFPVPGTLQARTLEWVAIAFFNAWNWKVKVKSLSCVPLLATPWTAAHQAPPSMGFSRQEYWSGLSLPSPLVANRNQLFPNFRFHNILSWFQFWVIGACSGGIVNELSRLLGSDLVFPLAFRHNYI